VIDFHCHLDLYPDPHQVVRECIARNLYVLSVTTTPSAWTGTAALVQGSSRIRTALGLHPQLAHQRKLEVSLFERLLSETRYVGEIGLDGTPEYKRHWSDQIAVFTHILDACGKAGGRILSIHSRRAATAVLDALEARPDAGMPVLHWFSGSQRELERAVALGCWFSIGPAMCYSDKGRTLMSRMPRDRILTESDGPFAQVGGRTALPWDTDQAVIGLAELWAESVAVVRDQLIGNLRRLVTDPASRPSTPI
jgi:TatD DNase family protein